MKILSILALSCALVACGGGGGGATNSTAPAVPIDPNLSVPMQKAITSFVQSGYSKPFTISGWVNNSSAARPQPIAEFTGQGNFTLGAPSGTSTIKGVSALKSIQVITGTVTANGVQSSIGSTATLYVNDKTFATVATVVGSKTTNFDPYVYPQTVKAGNTGSLGRGVDNQYGTSSTDYVVSPDSANSLLVTLIENQSGYRVTTVYRVDTAGQLNIVSITGDSYSFSTLYRSQVLTF